MHDFENIQVSTIVKRMGRIWQSEVILGNMDEETLAKDSALCDIRHHYNDSPLWKITLKNLAAIDNCMRCGTNNTFKWKGIWPTATINSIINTTRQWRLKDPLAKGAWDSSIPQTALLMWMLLWHHIPTMDNWTGSKLGDEEERYIRCFTIAAGGLIFDSVKHWRNRLLSLHHWQASSHHPGLQGVGTKLDDSVFSWNV